MLELNGSWPDLILVAKSIFTLGMSARKFKKSIVFDFATSIDIAKEPFAALLSQKSFLRMAYSFQRVHCLTKIFLHVSENLSSLPFFHERYNEISSAFIASGRTQNQMMG